MNKKVIVFDVDGTLFDTKHGIIDALNFVLCRYGKKTIDKSEEDRYIGPSIKESLINLQGFKEINAQEATFLYRKVYTDKFIKETKAYPQLEESLSYLFENGYVLGIATMKTQAQIDKLFEMFKIKQYFSVIKTAADDGSLTKTQMLQQVKRYNNDANRFYMVGDTTGDYKASNEAGYHFVAADYGYGKIEKIENIYHIGLLSEIVTMTL